MGVRLVVHNFLSDQANYTGTHNHDDLLHRDWVDQHPIYAITGLQEVLNTIERNLIDITNTLIQKEQEIKTYAVDYTNEHISALNTVLTERIDGLHILNDIQDTNSVDLDYDLTTKILKADVKLHQDTDNTNAISLLDDGLYVQKTVTKDSSSITWTMVTEGESLTEFILNGIRFSHNDINNYNNMKIPSDVTGWVIEDDKLVQTRNASSYNGIVSYGYYDDYKHTVRITSTDNDDDANGVVIGFVFDEFGQPHTISAMIQRNGNIHLNYIFALIYDFQLPGQSIIESYNLINSNNNNWSYYQDNGITLYVTKKKNLISVSATPWGYVNEFISIDDAVEAEYEATLSINLNDYSWGHYFISRVHYGYSNVSQQNSYFDQIFFKGETENSELTLSAQVKIDEDETNAITLTNKGLFAPQFVLSPDEDNGIELRNNGYYVKTVAMHVSEDRLNGLIEQSSGRYYVHKSHSFLNITQPNHGFDVGNFIYYDMRTNLYTKAIAIDSFDINVIGMVDYVEDENNFEVICNGYVETNLFTTSNGYVQGIPVYISDEDAGEVTQVQPNISKAVGYPINDSGIIISIERGIQYNDEAMLGDFKKSANDYFIRSDGFIKIDDTKDYTLSLVQKLLDVLDQEFINDYISIDNVNNTMRFKNIEQLYTSQDVQNGLNLFIKAF